MARATAPALVRLAMRDGENAPALRKVTDAAIEPLNHRERARLIARLAHVAACLAARLPDDDREAVLGQFEAMEGQ